MNQHGFDKNYPLGTFFKGIVILTAISLGGALGGVFDLLFCSQECVPLVVAMVPAFLPCVVACLSGGVIFGGFIKVPLRWLFLWITPLMVWGVLVSEWIALYYHWYYELIRVGIDAGRYPFWCAFRDFAKGDSYFIYRCLLPFGVAFFWLVFSIFDVFIKAKKAKG